MIVTGAIMLVVLGVVPMPWGVVLVAGAAVVDVAESLFLLRWSRRRRSAVGAEALVGKRAVVVTELWPEGQVRVDGELWKARYEGGLEAGREVVVRAVDGLTLDVEPVT